MIFSSTTFLFCFLPAALAIYWLFFGPYLLSGRPVFQRLSNAALLAASLFFYAWGEPWFVGVMLFSIAVNYGCGLVMDEDAASPAGHLRRRLALMTSLVVSLGLLGYFKYFEFAVDGYVALARLLGGEGPAWSAGLEILLPLGISFYTFQSLSYTIDVYRGQVAATRSFLDFACYVSMFPQLVAGPIVRYGDIAGQLVERSVDVAGFASGVRRFAVGLAKKVLLANTLAVPTDAIYAIPTEDLTASVAWFGACCYTLQLYFDFSGYSDMAIGLGRMLGFVFPENFRYPYIARSNREYWRRWHISLSSWFRDYLYVPLGGNRLSSGRTAVNLLTVFLLCALWHGANWTLVAYGLYQGTFLVLERGRWGRWLEALPNAVGHVYLLLLTTVGFVFFRAENLSHSLGFHRAMLGLGQGNDALYPLELYLRNDVVIAFAAGSLLSLPVLPALQRASQNLVSAAGHFAPLAQGGIGALRLAGVAALVVASAMLLSAGTHNPFIYFRF